MTKVIYFCLDKSTEYFTANRQLISQNQEWDNHYVCTKRKENTLFYSGWKFNTRIFCYVHFISNSIVPDGQTRTK